MGARTARRPTVMRKSVSIGGVVAGAIALVTMSSLSMSAQTPARKAPAKAWSAPKTPWGEPDISGVWTSDSVRGIPTQRPETLAGRSELTDEEYAAKVKRDEQTRKAAENAEGAFRNDGAWLKRSFR